MRPGLALGTSPERREGMADGLEIASEPRGITAGSFGIALSANIP